MKPAPAQQEPEKQPEVQAKPRSLKTLLEWSAPSRLFKKREREYFTTIGAIAFLVCFLLLLFKEWMLIVVIIAFVFASYVMSTIAPDEADHKITTLGIVSGGKRYDWDKLKRFWFGEKWGQRILFADTMITFPRRLILLLNGASETKIRKILSEYLPEEEPEKTWIDKASEWLSARVPLEKEA